MKLMDQVIHTPYDGAGAHFDPDWRDRIARTWIAHEGLILDTDRLYNDAYIKKHHTFLGLRQMQQGDIPPYIPDDYRSFLFAYECAATPTADDMKARLDALLLTDAPYSVIARDLGGSRLTVEDIRTYERLYFNIRDREGRLDDSCFLRTKFAAAGAERGDVNLALPIFWRVTAYLLGYTGLIRMWGWSLCAHGELQSDEYMSDLYRHTIQSRLMERVLSDQISTFDMNVLFGNNTEDKRLRKELASGDKQVGAARQAEFIAEVLKRTAPKMLPASRTVDEQTRKGELWNARIDSTPNVAGFKLREPGAEFGNKAVRQSVDEQFKSMRTGR